MSAMFVARLICSDADCAEESELRAGSLEELERLLCDCGCALELIAWPDWADEVAEVIALGDRSARVSLPRAA